MKISHQDYETVSVLTISGDFIHDDVEHFKRVASERRAAGIKHVLINCESLEFIDSAGLECWLRLQESLGEAGGQMRLLRPDQLLAKILALTRLDLAFEAHPNIESAIRSLR
ncbi:MAG: STAS domain-containing protein [Phycisphaerae bacterium]|nr:STAS domain-containing protein [Phycisphaerae bacterium]